MTTSQDDVAGLSRHGPMRTEMQQQQAAVNLRSAPLQGGGIPEDSLDQVFQYGYTTVDDGNLSAQVLSISLCAPKCKGNDSLLHSAGDLRLICFLMFAEESSAGSLSVALWTVHRGLQHVKQEARSDVDRSIGRQ